MSGLLRENGSFSFAPDRVGLKGLHYPVRVRTRTGALLDTVATIDIQARLPRRSSSQELKEAARMLPDSLGGIDVRRFRPILEEIRRSLGAEAVKVKIKFPYFLEKQAPVSGSSSLMDYNCSFAGISESGGNWELKVGVNVPISTLCPCSKEISDQGAHSQRGSVKVKVLPSGMLWLEDLIALVEEIASSPLYGILEEADEKYCTEHSYDNPRFVEDVVREVALRLRRMDGIKWFQVEAENVESIHNHSAYAFIEMDN